MKFTDYVARVRLEEAGELIPPKSMQRISEVCLRRRASIVMNFNPAHSKK